MSFGHLISRKSLHHDQIGSSDVFFGIGIVASLNGFAPAIAEALSRDDLVGAIGGLFGIDPVVLLAVGVALTLCCRAPAAGAAGPVDAGAAALAVALVLLPHKAAGWAALGLLGGFGLIAHRRDRHLAAAAALYVAIALYAVAGQVALSLFAPTLGRVDAALAVAALQALGEPVVRHGNVIVTERGYDLVVIASCVFLGRFLQAWLCCMALSRAVRPVWRRSEMAMWGALALIVIAINTVRLTLYGLSLDLYQALHSRTGNQVLDLLILSATLLVTAIGLRHEIWSRRLRA